MKEKNELDKIYLMKKLQDWMYQSKENYDAVMQFGIECCEEYYKGLKKAAWKTLGFMAIPCLLLLVVNFILEKKNEKDLEKSFPDDEE